MEIRFLLAVSMAVLLTGSSLADTFSLKLVHRFSEEVRNFRVSKKGEAVGSWPKHRSMEYYNLLASSDLQRQKMKVGDQLLYPSEGSLNSQLGNDFGWLHYTWIDVGTPNASFLVALDSGSDVLWLPCDCIQCGSLSSSSYSTLGRDLTEYNPSGSSTSKHLPCSHKLCEKSPSCKSPTQPCPYRAGYLSGNTSSSGLLVQDTLHFASSSGRASKNLVQAPVIIGCGRQQSGFFLDHIAPDGVMGLGFGNISVPSILAKAGLVSNSFSICFNEDDSGRIFFGDQGVAIQQSTPFLPYHGQYITYIVGVGGGCVGTSCLKQSYFQAQVDSGSSFSSFPEKVFEKIVEEFDKKVSAKRFRFEGYPWEYCYKSSSPEELFKIPSLTFMFAHNNSFVVHDPTFPITDPVTQGIIGFCLAIERADSDLGVIGQNFMTGYHLVFDREDLKLHWSRSNCTGEEDLSNRERVPVSSPTDDKPENPLPTNEQQRTPFGQAIAPAIASRTPPSPSVASPQLLTSKIFILESLQLLLLLPFLFLVVF